MHVMLLLCTWITNALTPSVNMETHLWVYRERGREGERHYKLIGDILSTIVKGSVQRGRQEGLRGGQRKESAEEMFYALHLRAFLAGGRTPDLYPPHTMNLL